MKYKGFSFLYGTNITCAEFGASFLERLVFFPHLLFYIPIREWGEAIEFLRDSGHSYLLHRKGEDVLEDFWKNVAIEHRNNMIAKGNSIKTHEPYAENSMNYALSALKNYDENVLEALEKWYMEGDIKTYKHRVLFSFFSFMSLFVFGAYFALN